jgi:hypothetical protein
MHTITTTIYLHPTDTPLPIPEEYLLGPHDSFAYKFIVTDDGALVIGPMRHGLLAALYFKNELLNTDIQQSLRQAEKVYAEHILSAGAISHRDQISWGSTGFGITEPPSDQALKSVIEQKINEFLAKPRG